MTHFIAHRVNTTEELRKTPMTYGVEIDLRPFEKEIILEHDPFINGELFSKWMESYKHGTLILNIKSERIEEAVLKILQEHNCTNYFFLDSSFPMIHLLAQKGNTNLALRFSEFEGIDTIINMRGKARWVWVDCFTKFPLVNETYKQLKGLGYKLCLVSPELQGRDQDIEPFAAIMAKEKIHFDAICTKLHNIERWQSLLNSK